MNLSRNRIQVIADEDHDKESNSKRSLDQNDSQNDRSNINLLGPEDDADGQPLGHMVMQPSAEAADGILSAMMG